MSKRAPISMVIIARDEQNSLEECLTSFRDYVEEIIVIDTGSKDKTVEIAKKYADIVETFTDCNNELGEINDFSMARNYGWGKIKQPFGGWIDSDDILANPENIIKYTDRFQDSETPLFLNFPYEYSYSTNGNETKCNLLHFRERIFFKPEFFNFVSPVHEVCIGKNSMVYYNETRHDLIWKHRRQYIQKYTPSNRNLRILENWIAKHGDSDARQIYYYALELGNCGQIEKSKENLKKYYQLSGWDDEKYMSLLRLLSYEMNAGNYQEVIRICFQAIELKPTWGEGYFALAKAYYFLADSGVNPQENWNKCITFGEMGLSFPPTQTLLFVDPNDRGVDIYRYINIAYNKTGRIEEALKAANQGLSYLPSDGNLLQNKTIYEKFLIKQTIHNKVHELFKHQNLTEQNKTEILRLLENPEIKLNHQLSNPPKILNGKLDIIFFVGDGLEETTPDLIKKEGRGGSETLAYEFSKRLAKKGHRVRVYANCSQAKVYDGVEWFKTEDYRNLTCDILIVSRQCHALDYSFNIQSKFNIIWCHDIYPKGFNQAFNDRMDLLFVLSEWHKQFVLSQFSYLKAEKIYVTQNGIDLEKFNFDIKRNSHKAICTSSPDRYLCSLLSVWQQVRKYVNDAELELYYGWENWSKSAELMRDNGQLKLIKELQEQVASMKDLGVTFKGRVNEEELNKAFLSSGVWAYPTWFTETSCVSCMAAQKSGNFLITSPIAGLNETAGKMATMIDGDWLSDHYINNFATAIVDKMLNGKEEDRVKLQKNADDRFDLNKIVDKWENLFYNRLSKEQERGLKPYKPVRGFVERS